jgi:hypothetical protein
MSGRAGREGIKCKIPRLLFHLDAVPSLLDPKTPSLFSCVIRVKQKTDLHVFDVGAIATKQKARLGLFDEKQRLESSGTRLTECI